MEVGFVFTNYNNTQYTKEVIESIIGSDAFKAPIIVVDNASKKNHKEELKELELKYDNVIIIYNEDNIGYFKGLNTGIKYGRKAFELIKYWVIGNNDLIFPKNIYSDIIDSKNILSTYPVISPNIVTVDGIPQNPHVITGISKIREFVYDLYHANYIMAGIIRKLAKITHSFTDRSDESQHEIAQEICQGYGACYILTPMFFENFKELWSPTFLMYEEYFLSLQLERRGFKTYYEPSIKVQHHWHATTATLPKKFYWELSRDAHKEYRKYVKFWR